MRKIEDMGVSHQVGAATSFLNSATVYKAFGRAEEAIFIFERAKDVYEKELDVHDLRLAGLYNNMGLALVDLKRFDEAEVLYKKAISIMEASENGGLEAAITYLNIASALEVKLGLVDADEEIQKLLDKAQSLIEAFPKKDGYYAFVCEK
jgi:tetratricopeptide (TPR) repeat protein